jgi:hypothetical protein
MQTLKVCESPLVHSVLTIVKLLQDILWNDQFSNPYCIYLMRYHTGILHFGHRIY